MESHELGRIFANNPSDDNWNRLYQQIADEAIEDERQKSFVKGYDSGYQQGKADASCMTFAEIREEAYKKGQTDTYDEVYEKFQQLTRDDFIDWLLEKVI